MYDDRIKRRDTFLRVRVKGADRFDIFVEKLKAKRERIPRVIEIDNDPAWSVLSRRPDKIDALVAPLLQPVEKRASVRSGLSGQFERSAAENQRGEKSSWTACQDASVIHPSSEFLSAIDAQCGVAQGLRIKRKFRERHGRSAEESQPVRRELLDLSHIRKYYERLSIHVPKKPRACAPVRRKMKNRAARPLFGFDVS